MADKQQEWRGGYGETSPGEPPRYIGISPGFGQHGMGYGPGGGSTGGSFGVYGLPHGAIDEYAREARGHGGFDEPHGRMPFGWTGSFGTAGEHSAPQEHIGPAEHPQRMDSGWDRSREHEISQPRPQRRGPKIQRTDQRIREDICDHLTRTQHIDPSDVMVEVKDGIVRLLGTVPHRAMKHWIEDIAAETSGVKDVENKLNVAIVGLAPADEAASPK